MKKLFILITLIVLVSCSHTNNLKKYNLEGENIYFETVVASSAGEAIIDFGNAKPAPEGGFYEIIKDIALSVGNTVLTYEMERRLRNASRPDSVVKGIAKGFETSMIKFLRIEPIYKLNDRSNYIVTTTLEKFRMFSTSGGVFINITATVEILCREDGAVVWSYDESETIPIRRDHILQKTAEQVFLGELSQMIELATLSENQIKTAIYDAAFEIGKDFSETLRQDISKLKGR